MSERQACRACRDGQSFELAFTMAFQPIVDVVAGKVWGFEALVRGPDGQPASEILSGVTDENRYAFDQACRVKAIELAGQGMSGIGIDPDTKLSINFLPNAVYEPRACIKATLAASSRVGFDPRRLMFEFTEDEPMRDTGHVENIISQYRQMGFTTALDDFGAGHAGLGLLARFQPDLIKLDMEIIRGVDTSRARQVIVAGIVSIARELSVSVLAEGVETAAEADVLRSAGIRLFQGYHFGRPQLESFIPWTASVVAKAESSVG